MSMVDRLIHQLKLRGLSIKPGNKPGELILSGPNNEKTPEIMEAVKTFKPELLSRFARVEPKSDLDDNPRGDAIVSQA